jgi:hypothetical protein
MTLKEITERFSNLSIYEQRQISDDYDELVFYNKDIGRWNKLFTDILGPPLKPAEAKPTKDVQSLTEYYGGIDYNQTLFKKEFDDVTVMVMFWPWSDEEHTTLKIIILKK